MSCYCIEKIVEEEFKLRDLIAVGKVISVDSLEVNPVSRRYYGRNLEITRYKIFVNKVYKGKLTGDTIYLFPSLPATSCEKHLDLDSLYIIYSSLMNWKDLYPDDSIEQKYKVDEDSVFCIRVCDRTRLYNESEISELKRIINSE